jgi:hypothetical protein
MAYENFSVNLPGMTALDTQKAEKVQQAVLAASQKTGAKFSYLMAKAARESRFDENAQCGTSSAAGLFQFVDQTWLEMFQKHGDKYGYGDFADKITKSPSGRFEVSSAEDKKIIMSLKKDPQLSACFAGEYTKQNENHLQKSLGREASNTDLYLSHFLGPRGAVQFLQSMKEDQHAEGASLLPRAAAANRSVFYHRDGGAKTLGEIYANVKEQFQGTETVNVPRSCNANDRIRMAPRFSSPLQAQLLAKSSQLAALNYGTNPYQLHGLLGLKVSR